MKNKWEIIERSIESTFVRKIFPIWIRKRENFESFADWERFCLNFNSFEFIPKVYQKLLLSVFQSEKNLNYMFFWQLNGDGDG